MRRPPKNAKDKERGEKLKPNVKEKLKVKKNRFPNTGEGTQK